jgi:hypothetical protein
MLVLSATGGTAVDRYLVSLLVVFLLAKTSLLVVLAMQAPTSAAAACMCHM